jgi:hypothetical protein
MPLETRTAGSFLFFNDQRHDRKRLRLPFGQLSSSTSNESFVLGGADADTENVRVGPPTGTLVGGHTYVFSFDAGIVAYPTASSVEADASGWVTLLFVPEPAPLRS